MESLEERREKCGKEEIFEEIMAKTFPNLMKTINHSSKKFSELQAQEKNYTTAYSQLAQNQ